MDATTADAREIPRRRSRDAEPVRKIPPCPHPEVLSGAAAEPRRTPHDSAAPAGNTKVRRPSRLASGEHLRRRTLGDGGNGTAQDNFKRVQGHALPHSFSGSCPQFISE